MGAERERLPDEERASAPTSTPLAAFSGGTRAGGRTGDGPRQVDLGGLFGSPTRVGATPAVQAKLEVGGTDDPFEREADRMADDVLRQVDPGAVSAPLPSGRVARSAVEIGAEGGPVSPDLQRSIESSSGAPLDSAARSTMEQGFATDLSGVRIHTDSAPAQRIQARAFTHGSDIHFAPGQYQPDSSGGRRLLAHELAHVVQQRGGGEVSRAFWTSKTFLEQTKQRARRKATAQKDIATLLDEYHEKRQKGDLQEANLKIYLTELFKMNMMAQAYIDKNTKVDGQVAERTSRSSRIAGMRAFQQAIEGESAFLKQRLNHGRTDEFDTAQLEQTASQDGRVVKIKEHYTGNAESAFRKLGYLIDAAVPAPGDGASIALTVKIPVSPGVFISLGFGAEASRGYRTKATTTGGTGKPPRVDAKVNVDVGAGCSLEVVEIAGALGGYLQSSAESGADAAELMSYALFRRARSSKLVPREVTNFMWGEGNADKYGWLVAEQWSKGVETRLLESNMQGGEEKNENFVESGAYAKLKAKVGIDKLAAVEGSALGFTGTRINATSLKTRKGGAGAANLRSGASPTAMGYSRIKTQATRGTTQKNVGLSTHGLKLSASAGNDFVGGGLDLSMRWMSNGAHGKQAKVTKLTSAELSGSLSFTMPGGEIVAGKLGNIVPAFIKSANTLMGRAKERAREQEGSTTQDLGALGDGIGNIAASFAELGSDAEIWKAPAEMADPTSGYSSSTTFTLTVAGDFIGGDVSVTISQDKTSEVAKVAEKVTSTSPGSAGVSLEMKKTSTLLTVTRSGGTWKAKWAGNA